MAKITSLRKKVLETQEEPSDWVRSGRPRRLRLTELAQKIRGVHENDQNITKLGKRRARMLGDSNLFSL